VTGQSVQVSLKVNPHTVDDNTKRKGKSDDNINVNVNDQSDHNFRCLRQTVLSPCQIQKSILSSCTRTTQNVKEKYDQYPVSCSGRQRPVDEAEAEASESTAMFTPTDCLCGTL
jgi:hypothetical protein